MLSTLKKQEEGQGLVEYGLVLVLVAVVVVAIVGLLGDEISTLFSEVVTMFP